jgi:hypothetical protein
MEEDKKGGACGTNGAEVIQGCRGGDTERKRARGKPRRRWKDFIKCMSKNIGRGRGMDLCGSGLGKAAGYL